MTTVADGTGWADGADAADLALAHRLADLAAAIALPAWNGPLSVRAKDDGTLVTEVDVAIDETISAALAAERPDDVVHSEELSPGAPVSAGRRWYVDPLDQTVNYSRGLPEFATLIALYDGDAAVCAVVSAPALGERWWASRGRGAHTASGRLAVSARAELSDAVASIAAPHRFDRLAPGGSQRALAFARRCRATTGAGGFLGHMRVAEGKVDVAIDPWGEVWDLAASALIVREAGGVFTSVTGGRSVRERSAIACNPRLHADVVGLLAHPGTAER